MDAAAKRDLHDAIWRSSGGFDLVLAPVLIALLGLWIDSAAGTRPVFMLAFLAFGTVGAVLKVYYDYQRGMAEAAEHVAAVSPHDVPTTSRAQNRCLLHQNTP